MSWVWLAEALERIGEQMALRAYKPCSHPGCAELIREGSYCDEHKKAKQKAQDERRGSASKRGYDSRWNKVRRLYMNQEPLCERCKEKGLIVPADLVHHKKRIAEGGSIYDFANLMSCCARCHDEIHREQGDKW